MASQNSGWFHHTAVNVSDINIRYPFISIIRYSWRYQLKEFSKDYHVIAIDQRGYAQSDKPSKISDYHIEKMVGDIRQLVKQLGK